MAVPSVPGVYLLKDTAGQLIYIGKAVNLRNRIKSYFNSSSQLSPKTLLLVDSMADFEFFTTNSEQEALILELNLIKRFRPRFNIRLKDDKTFPYLKLDTSDDYPRLAITRRVQQDGARYFGPFSSAGSVRRVLRLVKRIFPFRSCTKPMEKVDSRVCLDYHIGRCLAPCIGAVDKTEYSAVIRQVTQFLEGRHEAVLRGLHHEMNYAADQQQYEKAAILRDRIRAVEQVIEGQRIATAGKTDKDVIAFVREGDAAWVEVFFIRNGKLTSREHFILQGTRHEESPQIMANFIKQFYASSTSIPPLLLLQHPVDDMALIQQWLASRRDGPIKLVMPRRGVRKSLVDMVSMNAHHALAQKKLRRLDTLDELTEALENIEKVLYLTKTPRRMECFDISAIRGTAAVASMVVFEDGKPRKNLYRRFRINTASTDDDYAMIREVLLRRFKRHHLVQAGEDSWGKTPDLIIVDGGKGHLKTALETMMESDVDSIPVAAIAKEREEIFLPDLKNPLLLPNNSPGLHLIQRIRDEAHRFALSYHTKVRSKGSQRSIIHSIPGIGPKRARYLLRRFGTVNGIGEASVDELSTTESMTRTLAERVKQYLYSSQI